MSNVEISQVAYEGRITRLKMMLEANPKLISVADQNCRQPLHWACSGGHRDVVQFLLSCSLAIEGSIDINSPDDAQWTPLHISTSAGHCDIVLLLLETGLVDVNAVNGQDQTALFYAVSKNRIEICEILLASGADPNIYNNMRVTPIHRAASKDHYQILEMLLNARCQIDSKDSDNNTPLHLACGESHIRSIRILVERGASLTVKNKAGKTPLELCTNPGIIDMLKGLDELKQD